MNLSDSAVLWVSVSLCWVFQREQNNLFLLIRVNPRKSAVGLQPSTRSRQCSLQGVIKRRLCLAVFLFSDAALLAFHFQLKQLFLHGFQQEGAVRLGRLF